MKNIFKQENILLQLPFNPGLTLTGFRTTRPCSLQCVVQPNFNGLSNVANAWGNIANTFQNNNSALGSVSNGLKNVQCIFKRIFNAFLTSLLCRVFVNRVTYSLTHPTETAIRRLVYLLINALDQKHVLSILNYSSRKSSKWSLLVTKQWCQNSTSTVFHNHLWIQWRAAKAVRVAAVRWSSCVKDVMAKI